MPTMDTSSSTPQDETTDTDRNALPQSKLPEKQQEAEAGATTASANGSSAPSVSSAGNDDTTVQQEQPATAYNASPPDSSSASPSSELKGGTDAPASNHGLQDEPETSAAVAGGADDTQTSSGEPQQEPQEERPPADPVGNIDSNDPEPMDVDDDEASPAANTQEQDNTGITENPPSEGGEQQEQQPQRQEQSEQGLNEDGRDSQEETSPPKSAEAVDPAPESAADPSDTQPAEPPQDLPLSTPSAPPSVSSDAIAPGDAIRDGASSSPSNISDQKQQPPSPLAPPEGKGQLPPQPALQQQQHPAGAAVGAGMGMMNPNLRAANNSNIAALPPGPPGRSILQQQPAPPPRPEPFASRPAAGGMAGMGPGPGVGSMMAESPQSQQQGAPQAHQQAGLPQQGGLPQGGPQGMRELRVEDALNYLDDVKREFRDRPVVYNEFLAIMKNFKSQEVDTPGVIARVSKLFRGYNNLILGFNTFLPEGYKISLADLERNEAELQRQEALEKAQAQGQQPLAHPQKPGFMKPTPHPAGQEASLRANTPPGQSMLRTHQQPGRQWNLEPQQGSRPPQQHRQQSSPPSAIPPQQQKQGSVGTPSGRTSASPQQQQPHQAVEFDHAISYVTTIKRRFANDPSTYHSFLEILHTYQKEQRGIKEVLEQVAHLFQDHPDLLKEFTFFLPDAVQEQAKERLHRAAAESESRLSAQRQQMGGAALVGQQKLVDMTAKGGKSAGAARSNAKGAGGRKRKESAQQQVPAMIPHQHQQPETYVYNAAVERQFFDSAREALTSYTRDGGQAWAEFLKCLDMYAQEILSRSEMLNFVEPLLGKRNTKLFDEFKRILLAAGSPTGQAQAVAPLLEDSWYSVPLSEIDFSRCRRCSPSYRALPRDYPDPPCSDRNEFEASVLNDVWVSLPVGSEESYTFRHMRRNTYEETLFRCEDERFEIDMVIDSNAATLTRLEPVAKEIATLAQEEIVSAAHILSGSEGSSSSGGTNKTKTGMGGKRYQYSFDKKILGVIHRNSITRIYGSDGQEMLDLMVKNPSVAVPIVVQRLRQKDKEWRAARERLNRHWKNLAEQNYYKSLDHQSLTWRTIDKRATSTRTLLAEIKDRAVNDGRESKEAIRQKMEKAKEEHGTFYEVTMGKTLSEDMDLANLPEPNLIIFTPHDMMLYENVSWAQRDAYRILAFALERGSISPPDKERCHRLWMEFLGPFFGLPISWMQMPAVTFQESSNEVKSGKNNKATTAASSSIVSEDDGIDEDEESVDEDAAAAGATEGTSVTEESSKPLSSMDYHPLPAGAPVSTLFGTGRIVEFRRSDNIYAVRFDDFGATGYLRPTCVLCSLLPAEKSSYTQQLRAADQSAKLMPSSDHLCFGTQTLYLFLRLHQILVHRLCIAKRLAYSVGDDPSLQTVVEQHNDKNDDKNKDHQESKGMLGRRRYEAYLSLVYALLDGGVSGAAEGGKYEDRVRSLLGHGAYALATMDKLISHIWKNLQSLAGDETMWNLVQVYRRHLDAGSFSPEAMRQEAAYESDGEPIYAFQYCNDQEHPEKDQAVLYTEYMGVISEAEDSDDSTPDGDQDDNKNEMEIDSQDKKAVNASAPPPSKRQRQN